MKPSDDLIVSSTEPTGLNRKKVWMQKGKNLFNKDVVSQGRYLGADGLTYPSTASNVSGLIEIKAGVSYILSFDYSSLANTGNRAYNFYDEDKKILSSKTYTPSNKPILLTPEQNGYLRFAYDINCTNIQLEQSSIATEYEEYIEPKIYVKNDNNIYEEVVFKEQSKCKSLAEGKFYEKNSTISLADDITKYRFFILRTGWDYSTHGLIDNLFSTVGFESNSFNLNVNYANGETLKTMGCSFVDTKTIEITRSDLTEPSAALGIRRVIGIV